MKNLILSAAVLVSMTISANAKDKEPVNEKVMKTFSQVFKSATGVIWSKAEKSNQAYFTDGDVKTRVVIDDNGKLIQTVRYYGEKKLPAHINYTIKNDYAGKDVWGVTEITNKNGVQYMIVLKDNTNWYHVGADNYGNTELVSKYKRGDK